MPVLVGSWASHPPLSACATFSALLPFVRCANHVFAVNMRHRIAFPIAMHTRLFLCCVQCIAAYASDFDLCFTSVLPTGRSRWQIDMVVSLVRCCLDHLYSVHQLLRTR